MQTGREWSTLSHRKGPTGCRRRAVWRRGVHGLLGVWARSLSPGSQLYLRGRRCCPSGTCCLCPMAVTSGWLMRAIWGPAQGGTGWGVVVLVLVVVGGGADCVCFAAFVLPAFNSVGHVLLKLVWGEPSRRCGEGDKNKASLSRVG